MTIEDTSEYAGVIYGLHNGNFDYRYIGQTIRPLKSRFIQHLYDARRGSLKVHNWMRKYEGLVKVCVLETFDEETIHLINERETFQIAQYRSILLGNGNMNLTDGGGGISGYKHTKEARDKISKTHKGRTRSEEHQAKLALTRVGVPLGAETKSKISESLCGNKNALGYRHTQEACEKMSRPKSEQHRKKLSDSQIGKKISAETKVKMSESTGLGQHTRWHVNRNLTNPECSLCTAGDAN